MPLAGTRVYGDGWADHHRPVVSQTQTATCTIRPPGGTLGAFDPDTGERPTTPYAAHYTGTCSVEALGAVEQEAITGSQELTSRIYRVTLDFDAAPDTDIGHLVTIGSVGRNGDPTLAGKTLTVESFVRGTTVWDRELLCSENLG
jgi:hypothetical protein